MSDDQNQLLSQLSPRQLQVMQLVSMRKSSKEIARELGISPATVDSHVAAIVDRLGVSSRRDAIAILQLPTQALPTTGDHHGGDSLVPRPPWYSSLHLARRGSELTSGSPPDDGGHTGLGSVLFRFVLDAFFVVVFFQSCPQQPTVFMKWCICAKRTTSIRLSSTSSKGFHMRW